MVNNIDEKCCRQDGWISACRQNKAWHWSRSVEEIDAFLYKKYKLTDAEIRFIDEKVQAMKDV